MALKGDLRELAVVDLIQLVNRIHQTGALTLARDGRKARLYYRGGQLVDARTAEHSGNEALVDIVDWTDGEFEFEQGAAPPQEETIQMELHRVIMSALRIKDERKEDERRRAEEQARVRAAQDASVNEELAKLAAGADMMVYICLADTAGTALAETRTAKAPPSIDSLRDWLLKMAKSHPSGDFKRVFLEDEMGTTVVARAGSDRIAIFVAEKGASFGSVSLWVGKAVARLAALQVPQSEVVAAP